MTQKDVVENIVSLPLVFEKERNKSMLELICESGYIENKSENLEKVIARKLRQTKVYIDYWIQYSESKRTDAGWFIRSTISGKYEVGYIFKGSLSQIVVFDNINEACACFVVREIDFIVSLGNKR